MFLTWINIYRCFFEMLPNRINKHGRDAALDLLPIAQAHNPHTKIKTHIKPRSRSHSLNTQMRTQMHCWINVVLNLAYYNCSANASWVNRCPGHSSLLSYNERWSCRFVCTHINVHRPNHMSAQLEPWQSTSRLWGFYLALWHCSKCRGCWAKITGLRECGSAADKSTWFKWSEKKHSWHCVKPMLWLQNHSTVDACYCLLTLTVTKIVIPPFKTDVWTVCRRF